MRKPAVLLVALAVITALHFSLHVGGHAEHVVHVTLRTAYLFPVIAAAVYVFTDFLKRNAGIDPPQMSSRSG